MSWAGHYGGMYSVPARCLNRDLDATPLHDREPGSYARMYGKDEDGQERVALLVSQGWTVVEVPVPELDAFFEMKRWCEARAGELGKDWINVALHKFIFRMKNPAMMFKLTYG